jgi:hypothetical protein
MRIYSNSNTYSATSSNENFNQYNEIIEPSPENIEASAEFEENRRRYSQPIFAAVDEIRIKEDDFFASQTVNNLMDLFEALQNYKNEIEGTDPYSVRETFRFIEEMYDRLIDSVAASSNRNVSIKSNEFSRIITSIYEDVQRKLGLAGGAVLFRKKTSKKRLFTKKQGKKRLFTKKQGKKRLFTKKHGKRVKKLTRKH